MPEEAVLRPSEEYAIHVQECWISPFLYDHKKAAQLKAVATSSLVEVREMTAMALVDASFSTKARSNDGKSRWQRELEMLKDFHVESVAIWSDRTSYSSSQQNITSMKQPMGGGTSPVCLLHNPTITGAMKKSSLLIFSTDGEVYENDVQEFSQQADEHFCQASLIICVVVIEMEDKETPAHVDVSVFAPLLKFPHVLVLHLEDGIYRVIMATQPIKEKIHVEIIDLTKWDGVPQITPDSILGWTLLESTMSAIPLKEGFRLLPDGQALSLPKLLSTTDIVNEDIMKQLATCIPSICLIAKNEGKLQDLRTWIEQQHQNAPEPGLAGYFQWTANLRQCRTSNYSTGDMTQSMSH